MKSKKIKKMLNSGKYDHMTVAEFAKMVNEPEEFDIDKWAEEFMDIYKRVLAVDNIAFLTDPNWTPTKVTHYTNRKDK